MTPGGAFVAVWQDSCDILARRFDASGRPLDETELQVNDFTPPCAYIPNVAADPSGNFVVAWTSYGSPGSDSDDNSIQARRFSSDGTPAGPQFQVNTYTTADQRLPAVATDVTGNFVIAWTTRQDGNEGYGYVNDSHARRFSTDGTPLGDDFRVNTLPGSRREFAFPGIAMTPDGEFVVVWESDTSAGTDNYYSIQARRYDRDGAPVEAQFQVNAYTTGIQVSPRAAIDSEGRLLVVWESHVPPSDIRARRFGRPGSPEEFAEFPVDALTDDSAWMPSVALGPDESFVVVWNQTDGDGDGVWGRQFRADADPVGDDFLVNADTSSRQALPTVAADALGNFVVTWNWSTYGPPEDREVRARRYDALFRDGFESADTGRWSVSIP